jgi:hypothetical protein
MSGIGRDNGEHGFNSFLEVKFLYTHSQSQNTLQASKRLYLSFLVVAPHKHPVLETTNTFVAIAALRSGCTSFHNAQCVA